MPRFGVLKRNDHSGRAQSLRTTCIYQENSVNLNPGAGVAATYVFTANGLYDPNITGAGHQPCGFDQYMALYNEYIVLGSTIRVLWSNADASNVALVGISLEDLATTNADWAVYIENGNSVYTYLDKASTGRGCVSISHKADIAKFSRSKILDDSTFQGNSGANPTDTHYYHLWVAPFNGTGDNAGVDIQVEIRYDVLFRDPVLTVKS